MTSDKLNCNGLGEILEVLISEGTGGISKILGKLFNEFGDTMNAPFQIAMKSGSGDLTIKRNRK